jgi:hypothetical protein
MSHRLIMPMMNITVPMAMLIMDLVESMVMWWMFREMYRQSPNVCKILAMSSFILVATTDGRDCEDRLYRRPCGVTAYNFRQAVL